MLPNNYDKIIENTEAIFNNKQIKKFSKFNKKFGSKIKRIGNNKRESKKRSIILKKYSDKRSILLNQSDNIYNHNYFTENNPDQKSRLARVYVRKLGLINRDNNGDNSDNNNCGSNIDLLFEYSIKIIERIENNKNNESDINDSNDSNDSSDSSDSNYISDTENNHAGNHSARNLKISRKKVFKNKKFKRKNKFSEAKRVTLNVKKNLAKERSNILKKYRMKSFKHSDTNSHDGDTHYDYYDSSSEGPSDEEWDKNYFYDSDDSDIPFRTYFYKW